MILARAFGCVAKQERVGEKQVISTVCSEMNLSANDNAMLPVIGQYLKSGFVRTGQCLFRTRSLMSEVKCTGGNFGVEAMFATPRGISVTQSNKRLAWSRNRPLYGNLWRF